MYEIETRSGRTFKPYDRRDKGKRTERPKERKVKFRETDEPMEEMKNQTKDKQRTRMKSVRKE